MTDTVVVGGGIVGASVAYHLAREGIATELVDRDDHGRATDAAAGVVSPATSSQNADPTWYDLAVRAFEYYGPLIASLESEQDGPTGYSHRELLAVAVDEDEMEEFERTKRRVEDRTSQSSGDYLATSSVREIAVDDAMDRFPPLAEPLGVLSFDDAARVDGRSLSEALISAGKSYGLETTQASVESVVLTSDRVAGVVTEAGGQIDADRVVVSGGAWSPTFENVLGITIPVEPVRGQVVHVTPSTDPANWPMLVSFRDKVMAPWPNGRVAIGATREPDLGFTSQLTVQGVRTVLDEIQRVTPGLGEARLTELRVGLRPVAKDGLPILGAVPGIEGAYVATGHGATGITHGPFTGKLIADLVAGHQPDVALRPFAVDRFE